MPETTARAIRVPDDVWRAALDAAKRKEEPLSEAVRRFLVRYAKT
jgi:hypothetical protein